MRILKMSLVAATMLFLGSQSALAQGLYLGLQGGANITHDTDIAGIDLDFDAGGVVGVIAGYRINPNFRVDAEITYRENDLSDFVGDVSSWAFMANGYYDFRTGTNVVPYIGGGVGYANVELDSGVSDDDDVMAYQVGVGIAYEASPQLAISLDYRFFVTEDPKFLGAKYEYLNSSIMVGLRYGF